MVSAVRLCAGCDVTLVVVVAKAPVAVGVLHACQVEGQQLYTFPRKVAPRTIVCIRINHMLRGIKFQFQPHRGNMLQQVRVLCVNIYRYIRGWR